MKEIHNIIFDFDGTLANTWPLMFDACKRVFNRHDRRDLTIEDLYLMAGPTEIAIIEKHLANRESVEAAVQGFLADYEQYHEELVEKDESILKLLRDLSHADIGLALCTGKSRRTLEISLEKLEWDVAFDRLVTGDDVDKPKPSPEGIVQIVNELKWNPENTIFVGDSNDDMQAGNAAGIRTFAARWMNFVQDKEYRIQPELAFASIEAFRTYIAKHAKAGLSFAG